MAPHLPDSDLPQNVLLPPGIRQKDRLSCEDPPYHWSTYEYVAVRLERRFPSGESEWSEWKEARILRKFDRPTKFGIKVITYQVQINEPGTQDHKQVRVVFPYFGEIWFPDMEEPILKKEEFVKTLRTVYHGRFTSLGDKKIRRELVFYKCRCIADDRWKILEGPEAGLEIDASFPVYPYNNETANALGAYGLNVYGENLSPDEVI